MSAVPSFVRPDEYLALERTATEKHEYVAGAVFAMSGASPNHATITINLSREVSLGLKGSPCRAFSSDAKVATQSRDFYSYPDLTVVCGTPEYDDAKLDVLTNPMVIFEILSPSTEAFDRGDKFRRYRTIPSLEEYVLVSQERPLVEIYRRKGIHWELEAIEGRDQVVRIESAKVELKLEEVYDWVEFPPENSEI